MTINAQKNKPNKWPRWRRLNSRLIAINAFGLFAFLLALLMLGQTRESLTEAYRQSLKVQAAIMAEALGGLDPVVMPLEPLESLESLKPLGPLGLGAHNNDAIDSDLMLPMLDIEAAKPLLRRLVEPTENRVRFYDRQGRLLIDTALLSRNVQIAVLESSETKAGEPSPKRRILPQLTQLLTQILTPPRFSMTESLAENGLLLEEVLVALKGQTSGLEREDAHGKDVLTLAVPVQYYRAISGVLLVTSPPGEIDSLVAASRWATLRIFAAVFIMVLGLTILLGRSITAPVSHLAEAMRQVRRDSGVPPVEAVPDFTARGDEIGDLSEALQDMMARLRERIDSIERFAADVAHELKNPLASLSSAVQTLEAIEESDRPALFEILKSDIQRMNKLIGDISEASRLDAELSRGEASDVDLTQMIRNTVQTYRDAYQLDFSIKENVEDSLLVYGQAPRICQIINNLLDNAKDFAPKDSVVDIAARQHDGMVEVSFSDTGSGINPDMYERIFDRFYTDRAHDVSSQAGSRQKHSGLGLFISRQIARAHGGDLKATGEAQSGACFLLTLPLESQKPRYGNAKK